MSERLRRGYTENWLNLSVVGNKETARVRPKYW